MKFRYATVALMFVLAFGVTMAAKRPVYHKQERVFSLKDEIVPGVVIIKFMPGVEIADGATRTNSATVNHVLNEQGVLSLKRTLPFVPALTAAQLAQGGVDLSRIYTAEVSMVADPRSLATRLGVLDEVEYAEPKFMHHINDTPNDPGLSNQTSAFTRMNAFNGWTIAKGSLSTPIAVVDGGTYWSHEDLNGNMYINRPEDINHNGRYDPGPPPAGDEDGIDQDGNGFIDDVIGWNFATAGPNPQGLSGTPNSAAHGTATASHFGAVTNNGVGMAGSSWNCSIIPVCAASPTTDDAIAYGYEGIAYAYLRGAKVINCSWGSTGGFSSFEQDVINAATQAGALVVCAAGNGTNNNGAGKLNDLVQDYPPGYKNVLAVGATNSTSDARASFSNYGRTVPVYAPGVNIWSALNGGGYGNGGSGTSYASPLTAGLAGIVKTQHPSWTPRQVALQIKTTSDSIDGANPALAGNLGHGRINFARALSESHAGIEIISATFRTPGGRNVLLQNDTIVATLTVQNILFANAANLVFSATSSDGSVTVLQGTVNAGTLNAGQQVTLPPFMFKVGTLTASKDLVLRFDWVSNTNERDSWAYKITVFPSTPQWVTQTSPTGLALFSVKAVDRNIVWASGGNGSSPAVAVVIRTTDGGSSWTDATGNFPASNAYTMTAIDANRAWVGTEAGAIYATTNGGTTWAQQTYPGTQSPFMDGIVIFNDGNGYAMGDPSSGGRFVVLKTTNFGQTWAHLANEPVGGSSEAGWNNAFVCTDVNHLWLGTNNSRVWRSTDGGTTWSSGSTSNTNSVSVAFKNVTNGIAGHDNGAVRITSDGGATWTAATSGLSTSIGGVAFPSISNTAWFVSGSLPYRSTNGGSTWASQSVYPITGTLYHTSFVDTALGWCVTSNGEILRYSPNGVTGVDNTAQPEVPQHISLYQNYPNPFNPGTKIRFEVRNGSAGSGPVSLKVYDVLGREVATLVNDYRPAGVYTAEFNASNLASGVYCYRLTAGGESVTKSMVLMK